MRLMGLRRWIGHSGVIEMIVEQLGLAMIPLCCLTASGLISGTTSGTPASIRNAEELSTTTAPPGPRTSGDRAEALRRAAAGREQRNVDTAETVLCELAHGQLLAAKRKRLT